MYTHRAYQLTIYQAVSYFASVQQNARTLSDVEREYVQNYSMVPATYIELLGTTTSYYIQQVNAVLMAS